ncbi:DUF2231 domain-containing protein [uncultured Salinisphaera sp.]|uniref:DUF2231 domain-containing protein n=1 Tax=uncultured Salinisphaera sp. TaxID=359372 RepID=UPI0032B1EAA7
MTSTERQPARRGIHPFHALLLGATFPLFLGAALCDYAYMASYQIEWSLFASWLVIGGALFTGLAGLCALLGFFVSDRKGAYAIYLLLLLVVTAIGVLNALIHARDAWAMMPSGFILSIVAAVLGCVVALLGFSRIGVGARS